MKMRLKKYDIIIFLLYSGVFLCTYYVRCGIVGNSLAGINLLCFLAVIYIMYYAYFRKRYFTIKFNALPKLFFFIISILYFVTQLSNDIRIINILLRYLSTIFPALLIYVKINSNIRQRTLNIALKIIDSAVGIMFIMLIIDILMNKIAINSFAIWSGNTSLIAFSSNISRFASIMGHYIPTAETYTIYFIIHSLRKQKEPNKETAVKYIICCLIAISGVCMTGSKTYIVTILLLLILFNSKKIKNILISSGIVLILNFSGLFDTVLRRFSEGNLSSGRTERLMYLVGRYNLFPLLIGNGSGSSYQFNSVMNWASAAFEYVFMMFTYEYGLLFAVLFYGLVFIYPFLNLVKNKKYIEAVSLGLFIVSINLYNGIGLGLDYMYLYAVTVFWIVNYTEEIA